MQTEEFERNELNCFDKGPDGCITLTTNQSINLGFVEAEEEKYQNEKTILNKGLHRLVVFAKNSIDQNYLLGALCIQDVGTSISFFLMKRQAEGFYTMVEIDHLTIPTKIAELPMLIGFVNNMGNLLHVLETNCLQ